MTNQLRLTPHKKRNLSGYLFILPFFVVYIAFQLYPQLYSFVLSFSYYKFGQWQGFVWLENFRDALKDRYFWISLGNTLTLWLSTLPVQLVVGFLIASAMSNIRPRARGMLSGVYYLPVVTNLVAVTLIFQLMFDKYYGVFNYLLQLMGVEPVSWLTNPVWAKVSTSVLIIWRGLGYYVVYTLAGLMSVDKSLYEYATLEGANYLQRQVHITIPSIAPILLYQAFTGTIAGWNIFLEPFLLFPKGSPLSSCMTTAIYIYDQGFKNLKFGYGAAMSIMVALVTTVFAVLQFRLFKTDRMEG